MNSPSGSGFASGSGFKLDVTVKFVGVTAEIDMHGGINIYLFKGW